MRPSSILYVRKTCFKYRFTCLRYWYACVRWVCRMSYVEGESKISNFKIETGSHIVEEIRTQMITILGLEKKQGKKTKVKQML